MKDTSQFPAENGCLVFIILFILLMIGLMHATHAQPDPGTGIVSPIRDDVMLVYPYKGKLATIDLNKDYFVDFKNSEMHKEVIFELKNTIDTTKQYRLLFKLVPKYTYVIYDNVAATYQGDWKQVNNPLYSSKYLHTFAYSNLPTDIVSFTFTGNGFELIGEKSPDHGILSITIDNNPSEIVDCYHTSLAEQVIVYGKELTDGEHTVVIRPTGLKNNAAKFAYNVIDGFRVRK